jgi:hypothetical protein
MLPDVGARLRREARMLTRYLLDAECPEDMVERYVEGCVARTLTSTDAVTAFAHRNPWSVALLDAAGALSGRAAGLRARIQLMAAILEASPRFTSAFFPSPSSRARALLRLGAYGLATAGRAAIGFPLLITLERGAT